ncbi:EAL domain-containing protein [Pseudomonas sp. sp1636]|uniref:putative bifunctional diguanylate cyclase/phosphodiesterase n=1 Tax=Pseudomonas sp. sp1636 TaxID=3036707 RepID=UPI0025A5A635|nr:EAL domain-containing protein [Pseudomonas sp. sp1636]MDM8349113.1 EAL domain-containing protein [Pseudomonas sp. sp1636]
MEALRRMPLRYKFWAVNGVAFISILLVVVVAMALEQRSVNQSRQDQARSLLLWWQGGEPASPEDSLQPLLLSGEASSPVQRKLIQAARLEPGWVDLSGLTLLDAQLPFGAWVRQREGSGVLAVLVSGKSFQQVFVERAPVYALAVFLLMLGLLFGSQMLIRFVESYQRQLQQMAHFDSLTGLPNRALAYDRLAHALDKVTRRGGHLAVLFIDLDRFKTLNDSYGHGFGDAVLRTVAQRLQTRCRQEDTLARLGGDEFLLILEQLPAPSTASLVARSLLQLLEQPLQLEEDHELYVGASIGIALYPGDGGSAAELIRNADAAMYRAKANGRNTCAHYIPCLTEHARTRFELERSLRGALHNHELSLHFQPLMRLEDGHCLGAEALLRWHSPQHGQVGPDTFIPLAEDSGLIVSIGSWVLNEACRQANAWREEGLLLETIAVNLSPIQFMQQDIVQLVARALAGSGLPAHCLELEITEGALMRHIDQAENTLKALKALGVRISVDDFGTGYSSLAYLRRFALDKLKIDKSFMAGVPANSSDCQLVHTIIAMARSMQLTVLAEGVETPEQQGWLLGEGCDQCQGYLLGRPMAAESFARHWQALSARAAPAAKHRATSGCSAASLPART